MGLRLDIKKILSTRSDRVKCVDFHPTEPWMLISLYNGHVHIWNFETQVLVKTFEVAELPARAGKFIARKNWIIVGTDDMHLRVFNYNTHEKVNAWEAHTDYIRCVVVHPSQSFVLSSADDMLIKLWDWEKNWKCMMTFEGHTHYVMSIAFNPKDANTFASASLDKSIKVWNIGTSSANYTLEGHEKGVNWVDYYHGGEKPYLVTAADDKLVKIWDYQNKTCVQTLEGHTQNVCVACFHPELPIIISGSEDGTVRVWHATTYRLENTLNYGLERVWTITYQRGSNNIGLGYDEGSIVIKLGREDPAISMDSSGKVIWAKHNEIQTAIVQSSDLTHIKDGERVPASTKDLGNCEIYPQSLDHSPNGRFAVVCGDGEFIIYTALSWRNKSFGSALDFVWANDSNEYAVRESSSKIKTFKAFKEKNIIQMTFSAEAIYGGALLGVRGVNFVCFYDWNTGAMVRRIDVVPKEVYWAENGSLLCLACADNFYVLRYRSETLDLAIEKGVPLPEDGLEAAFEVVQDVSESVKKGIWIGDCFIFTTTSNRLNYLIGSQVHTIAHFDTPMYLLGYLPKESRVLVCDKDVTIYSYLLPLQMLEYQSAILRHDFAVAETLLPNLPKDQRNRVARFLEGLDMKDLALEVTEDVEHKFDLALQLRRFDYAHHLAIESDSEQKWKQLGDFAMADWNLPLAIECMQRANDLPGLMLTALSIGDSGLLNTVTEQAASEKKSNMAFMGYYLTGRAEECLDLLVNTDRVPEAMLMARTFVPSATERLIPLWQEKLVNSKLPKIASNVATPVANEKLFPMMKQCLIAEMASKGPRRSVKPSSVYSDWSSSDPDTLLKDIIAKYPDGSGLPPIADLIQQVGTIPVQPVGTRPQSSSSLPLQSKPISPTAQQRSPIKEQPSPVSEQRPPSNQQIKQAISQPQSSPAKLSAPVKQVTMVVPETSPRRNESQADDAESISDNMSYASMEVNTTGTASNKGDLDIDNASDASFVSAPTKPPMPGSFSKSSENNPDLMDELDAALDGASINDPVASPSKTTTGDPDLDDLLDF